MLSMIARKLSSLTPVCRPLQHVFSISSSAPSPPLLFPSPLPQHPLLSGAAAAAPFLSIFRRFSSQPSSPYPPSPSLPLAFIRGGCYDADDSNRPTLSLPLCPGCGVHMQDSDPSLPGFFSVPSTKSPDYHAPFSALPLSSISDPGTSLSLKIGHLQELSGQNPDAHPHDSDDVDAKPLVCARCHSLRHYGRVKVPSAENLLPDFDFDRMIAPRIASPSGPPSVVLFVVDVADFDGSFPRKVARLLSASIERNFLAWKENKPANVPRIILVVTKIDLLPPALSHAALHSWVWRQEDVTGIVKLAGMHLVSAEKDWRVRNLVEQVAVLAGSRGNVWAVGAQNAGKSTLINAMGRCVGRKMTQLTEAPVPGTTLGIVRVEGLLCGQAKLFDTPGILYPYQITTRLTREEQKLVHMGKELKPRTYRIKAGHSIHIGGLMRVDVDESSANTIYLTVWASPLLPLHMGKKENSQKMLEDHFGRQLQPPASEARVSELGKWERSEFRVSGDSWEESSTDIAVAGLGWVAVCLKGEAVLGVWTYDGILVASRSSLIFERAKIFEESGFTVSKTVSKADSMSQCEKPKKSDKKRRVPEKKLSCISSSTSETELKA